MRFFTRIAAKVSIFFESAKGNGENNDYLIIGEVLHKVKTLEKAQAADGGSYGPPCMQLFLMGIAACAYIESNFIRSNRTWNRNRRHNRSGSHNDSHSDNCSDHLTTGCR